MPWPAAPSLADCRSMPVPTSHGRRQPRQDPWSPPARVHRTPMDGHSPTVVGRSAQQRPRPCYPLRGVAAPWADEQRCKAVAGRRPGIVAPSPRGRPWPAAPACTSPNHPHGVGMSGATLREASSCRSSNGSATPLLTREAHPGHSRRLCGPYGPAGTPPARRVAVSAALRQLASCARRRSGRRPSTPRPRRRSTADGPEPRRRPLPVPPPAECSPRPGERRPSATAVAPRRGLPFGPRSGSNGNPLHT